MTFRGKLSEVLSQLLKIALQLVRDYPRAGGNWCQELTAVNGRARFRTCIVSNKGLTPFWLWTCDASTNPDKSTLAPLYVPAATTQSISLEASPVLFSNGIYVCASTDPVTKTLLGTNDAFFTVVYDTTIF